MNALDNLAVRDLLQQSYRLTQTVLGDHGATPTRERSTEEINSLTEEITNDEIIGLYKQAKGPYARKDRHVILIGTLTAILSVSLIARYLADWLFFR